MKIGICDSDKQEALAMDNQIMKWFQYEKDFFVCIYSINDILTDLEYNTFDCNVIIMDMEAIGGELTVIDVSKRINRDRPNCQIIYISNYIETVLDLYETNHCYFLLKSDWKNRLKKAVMKACQVHGFIVKKRMLELMSERHKVFIDMRKILFIERIDRQIHVITLDKEYTSYQSIKHVMELTDEFMVQCHSGYIVNLNYITDIQGKFIEVAAKYQIPLGRTYSANLRERYDQMREEGNLLYQLWNEGVYNASNITK